MVYNDDYSEDEEGGVLKRFRGPLIAGLVVAVLAGFVAKQLSTGHSAQARKSADITMVSLPPAPPPPPPPPPPPEPEKPKMIEQTPVAADEQKPEDKPAEAPPDLSTNNQGPGGPDNFGMNSNGHGGNGHRYVGSGSTWGWYAAQVQTRIADALRRNSRTKTAGLNLKVRIWPDASGRVERASLVGTTGDTAMDNAIRNDVLTGLQLQEPPPKGMPSPIVLRISARKPD